MADAAQRGGECAVAGVVHGDAARAVGEDDHAVVRRALAVDRNGIERVIDGLAQRATEQRLRHRRIRRHEREHGRHRRLDHPRAFGHSADCELAAGDRGARRRFLRKRIRRHDRARRGAALVRAERSKRCGQAAANFFDRQRDADDASGSDKNMLGRAADKARRFGSHVASGLQTLLAGAGVGASAVDNDGASGAA